MNGYPDIKREKRLINEETNNKVDEKTHLE